MPEPSNQEPIKMQGGYNGPSANKVDIGKGANGNPPAVAVKLPPSPPPPPKKS
jgi:hypothetical protein